jgi:transposase
MPDTSAWCSGIRGFSWRKPRHTLQERQDLAAVAAGRARLAALKRQAAAGAIRLLFADESEVSTHPHLAHTWAPKGFDLKVQAPGQAKRRALLGVRDAADGELIVEVSKTKRSADFIRLLERLDALYGPRASTVPVVLVLDNGPIHKSTITTKALEERSSWLTPFRLPAYAPELNDIERDWRTLKRLHIANRVLRSEAALEAAVHHAIHAIHQDRGIHVGELPMAA